MAKELEPVKLIRISVFLSKNGLSWREREWICEAKKLIFVLKRYEDGEVQATKHIKKAEIFNIDSTIILNQSHIAYTVFSHPEDVEETKTLLLKKVTKLALEFQSDANALVAHLNLN